MDQRKILIDKEDKQFTVEQQCMMLNVPRSTYYYKSKGFSSEDLRIMRMMDEMYMEDPTRGTRRYSGELLNKGIKIGRDHVRTFMQYMGIYAIYPKPRTTVIDKNKHKYPYLLRGININAPNVAWCIDISYIPMRYGFMYLTAIIDVYSKYIADGVSPTQWMPNGWLKRLKQPLKSMGNLK